MADLKKSKMAGNEQSSMKYIDLLNHFWKLNAEYSFTPNEKAVYFALLYKWNELRRKDAFNQSNEYLAIDAGVSESSVKRAKKVLEEAKLIRIASGDGRKNISIYTLLSPAKGGHKEPLLNNKGVHSEHLCEPLSAKIGEKKGVTVTHNISILDIEETYSNKEREEEEVSHEKKSPLPLPNTSVFSSMSDVEFVCLNESSQWQESMMKRFGITSYSEIKKWIEKFFEEMKAQGQDKRNLTDTTSHCFNWIRIQIEKEKSSAQKEKITNGNSTKGVIAGLAWSGVQRRRKQ